MVTYAETNTYWSEIMFYLEFNLMKCSKQQYDFNKVALTIAITEVNSFKLSLILILFVIYSSYHF